MARRALTPNGASPRAGAPRGLDGYERACRDQAPRAAVSAPGVRNGTTRRFACGGQRTIGIAASWPFCGAGRIDPWGAVAPRRRISSVRAGVAHRHALAELT